VSEDAGTTETEETAQARVFTRDSVPIPYNAKKYNLLKRIEEYYLSKETDSSTNFLQIFEFLFKCKKILEETESAG
jgi:hypothetical protein